LTLGQAEAVEQVIGAASANEKRLGLARLGDRDSVRIHEWRDRLMHIAALIEAALDFSGEEAGEELGGQLAAMGNELAAAGSGIALGGTAGSVAPHIALVGLTNAGKSSLLNALVGDDAALVSAQTSTTRDSLQRAVRWDGVDLLLSDNPGFDPDTGGGGTRAAERALEKLGGEDIACWVIDGARVPDRLDEALAERFPAGVVIVMNKCDLPQRAGFDEIAALAERNAIPVLARAEVSASTGEGIAGLRSLLAGLAGEASATDKWSRREAWELRAALECCRAAAVELGGAGRLELAADDVRRGVGAFSRALGEGYAEEALARIFSRFCIGK
jgi:tRNA modification GTPase